MVNVLDFKKDMGLWHGVLTVSDKNVSSILLLQIFSKLRCVDLPTADAITETGEIIIIIMNSLTLT